MILLLHKINLMYFQFPSNSKTTEPPSSQTGKSNRIPSFIVNTEIYKNPNLATTLTEGTILLHDNDKKNFARIRDRSQKTPGRSRNIWQSKLPYLCQKEREAKKAGPEGHTGARHRRHQERADAEHQWNPIASDSSTSNGGDEKTISISYLVAFNAGVDLSKVKVLNGLKNSRLRREQYSRITQVAQCHICQRFGHGQRGCGYSPQCL